jgi:hypothetical protein
VHTKAHQVVQLLWTLCTQINAISSMAILIIDDIFKIKGKWHGIGYIPKLFNS